VKKISINNKNEVLLLTPRLPPSLNELLRMHWRRRAELQKAFDAQITAEWGRLRRRVFLKPVRLTFLLSFPNKRCRDYDNYIGGTKLIIDALKRTFLFRDDSEWIKSIEVKFAQGEEGTVILIQEV
jgi:Holliday junction resolvase RusA-like endonuclease